MSDRLKATLMVSILLLLAAVYFSQDLATGQYVRYDGFYTMERSGGFERFDDWLTVYSNNAPSARKPPLQYWLTGAGLKAGLHDLVALRLPSYVFLLGLLAVNAVLCYRLTGRNPWGAAAGVLLTVCSGILVSHGRSGMLDLGMSFFTMLAMLALYYTRDNPKAWLLCGLAMGLGAMQKAPVALVLVLVALAVLALRRDEIFRGAGQGWGRYFCGGMGLALILLSFWPALQVAKMGPEFLELAYTREMLERFSPVSDSGAQGAGPMKLLGWFWDDLGIVTILSGVCALAVLCFPRWRSDNFLFSFAIIALVIIVSYSLATGSIYRRYLAVLTPFLICINVRVIADMLPWRPGVFVVAMIFVGFSAERIQDAMAEIDKKNHYSAMRDRVQVLDNYRQEQDLVFLDKMLIFPGAYGYFGKVGETAGGINMKNKAQLARFKRFFLYSGGKRRSFIGIAKTRQLSRLEKITGELETHPAGGGLVVWRYQPPG